MSYKKFKEKIRKYWRRFTLRECPRIGLFALVNTVLAIIYSYLPSNRITTDINIRTFIFMFVLPLVCALVPDFSTWWPNPDPNEEKTPTMSVNNTSHDKSDRP